MSLSRPVRFPLLKLPWLCIEAVVKCWDVFEIIFFALTSKKARRVVKSFKIPLNRTQIFLSDTTRIWLGGFSKTWNFSKPSLELSFQEHSRRIPLMLRNNPIPLYTSRTKDTLKSYTHGNEVTALKLVMEFLNEVFNCSVEAIRIDGGNFPESGVVGVESTENLTITQNRSQPFGYAQSQKLSLLLENLEVTGTCSFLLNSTEKNFNWDPKRFKCQKLEFCLGSAAWITRKILLQFVVPRLTFHECPFSVEDIVSFVTQWFHSDNEKFEYFYIGFQNKYINLETFGDLNPSPFSGRNRIPLAESYIYIDYSEGLEIVRHDGLSANIHVQGRAFLFYVCHNQ